MIDIAVPVSAFCTLAVFSFVYKESPIWRFIESTYLGLYLGYGTILAIRNILTTAWTPIVNGTNYWFIGSLIFGALLYTRFSKKYSWLGLWPMGIIIGIGSGVAMRTTIESQILSQLGATFLNLIGDTPLKTFNNIAIAIMVTTSLYYFTYTGGTGQVSDMVRKIGRWTLMIVFGATFGATVLTRMTLFIGRFTFLWSPAATNYTIAFGLIILISLTFSDQIAELFKRKQ